MIVKSKEDVIGTKGEAKGDRWRSLRLLHQEDGIGVTLTDSILEAGFEMILWQKHHLEACYCLEGEGTVEELDTGKLHQIRPGILYAIEQPRPAPDSCQNENAHHLHFCPRPDRPRGS